MSFSKMTLKELALYLEERGRLSPAEEAQLQADRRRGAGLLLERYRKRQERERLEEARLQKMLRQERFFWRQGIKYIAGVDEAGRGPLAGPVVAAAVILPPETTIRYLDDSKKLTAARREVLYDEIKAVALGSAVGICSPAEIDRLNIYEATMKAMRGALSALPLEPGVALVDGFPIHGLKLPQRAIPGGDALSLSIAAASVVAKVTRDRIMLDLHRRYPEYGFDRNKGYGTREHFLALGRYGPCPEHRRSFRGIDLEREGS
ncbi:MAG: ribonuclease HII [Dethiobacteria bacterium]